MTIAQSNGNSPAFAAAAPEEADWQTGLTKREYFAARAMQGLLAGCADGEASHQVIATKARKYADELLKELAMPQP